MNKRLISSIVFAVAVASLSSCKVDTADTSAGQTNNGAAGQTSSSASNSSNGSAAKAPRTPAKPKYTVAQRSAIQSAESYIEMSGFSRAGLIQQLSSKAGEGFAPADAVFAVDHIKVDWKAEAVESAKSYMEMGGFSRASLIQQLSSKAGEQFTRAQAEYAAHAVGL